MQLLENSSSQSHIYRKYEKQQELATVKVKKIIFFGAHPDDAEILCGGTAIKLARAGHKIKFVSTTNGDTGHFRLSRAETAKVRYQEAQNACKITGVDDYQIFSEQNCGIEPTLENRLKVMRVLRSFNPDLVITHRLCDYHPDHRTTAQLVLDCAYTCMVPHFCEDTPVPDRVPVFAHCFDRFTDPRPHRADAAIEIDSVMDEKLAAMSCHYSQFFEWLPYADGNKDFDASKLSESERKEHLLKWVQRFRTGADNGREALKRVYGEDAGSKVIYAEVFEQSPYSRQLPLDEFQALFMA